MLLFLPLPPFKHFRNVKSCQPWLCWGKKKISLEELGDVFFMWSQNPEGRYGGEGKSRSLTKASFIPNFNEALPLNSSNHTKNQPTWLGFPMFGPSVYLMLSLCCFPAMALPVFSKTDKLQICSINLFGGADGLRRLFIKIFLLQLLIIASNLCGNRHMKSGFPRISVSRAD